MMKRMVLGLVGIAMLLAVVLPGSVWAQVPEKAQKIHPVSVKFVDQNGAKSETMPAHVARQLRLVGNEPSKIENPGMWAWLQLGKEGAVLNLGVNAIFPITAVGWWVDGARENQPTGYELASAPTSVGVKSARRGVDYTTSTVLQVGIHTMVMRVYPDYPNSTMHFLAEFAFDVQWFEFWVDVRPISEDSVQLSFYISAIGGMPGQVKVSVPGASTNALPVVANVVTVEIGAEVYAHLLGGYQLDTTISEVGYGGRSSTHSLCYPSLGTNAADVCSIVGGGGKG